jgi:hypothetical protein
MFGCGVHLGRSSEIPETILQDDHPRIISEKRGDEIKNKSSPLKLLSQSQPNFAEMIQNYIWYFRPPTKMATTAERNLT